MAEETPKTPFHEHAVVIVTKDVEREGATAKRGDHATIVSVFRGGEAYAVEITEGAVVTVYPSEITDYGSKEAMDAQHPLMPGVKFGVYDTQDNCWIGDSNGPRLFEDQEINGQMLAGSLTARVAAEFCGIRMGWPPGRCKARPFQEGPLVHRDNVTPRMTLEEAVDRKLSGGLL